MNHSFRKLLTVLLVGLIMSPHVLAAGTAESLYEEAVLKESGERNLEGAIDFYRQAIEQAGLDHRLASKARLHMAACYERLGKTKEAEEVYLQIVSESAAAIGEIAQEAQVGLERLQAQEKKARDEAASAITASPMIPVREFKETRASFSIGPAELLSRAQPMTELSIALRYRLSAASKPLALYVEVGALPSIGDSYVVTTNKIFDSQVTDSASLSLQYQTTLALIAEMPHGIQRTVIPEVGAGLAITSSKITFQNGSSSGELVKRTVSPYMSVGLHLFPDHILSILLQGNYVALPYPDSVQFPSPPHPQTFDFPSSLWNVALKLQIKIGWPKLVMRPRT